MKTDLEKVQEFIFNNEVQTTLSNILNHLMSFNILEITGMGTQEIKHSNILGWFFDAAEHNLEYQILNEFLRKVIQENSELPTILGLQEYLYLAKHKKNITIYREKDNIDLLIVDEANKLVITIENKVYAGERTEETDCDGENLGQLACYEKRINKKYNDDYRKYFIFLTVSLEVAEGGKERWLRAKHQHITDVLNDILKTKNDLGEKTKIIFESYIDLLKRSGIVQDKILQELCKKIWDDDDYRKAFEIILNNKPHRYDDLVSYIKEFKGAKIIDKESHSNIKNIFVQLNNKSPFIYRFMYNIQKSDLGFVVVSSTTGLAYTAMTVNKQKLSMRLTYNKDAEKQFGYYIVSRYLSEYKKFMIEDKDINEEKVHEILKAAQENDIDYLSK